MFRPKTAYSGLKWHIYPYLELFEPNIAGQILSCPEIWCVWAFGPDAVGPNLIVDASASSRLQVLVQALVSEASHSILRPKIAYSVLK